MSKLPVFKGRLAHAAKLTHPGRVYPRVPDEEGWCATIPDRNIKPTPMPTVIHEDIEEMQAALKARLRLLRNIKDTTKALPRSSLPKEADTGELLANLTLAIRHIEYAHTRLGWALEAYRGES